MANIAVRPTRAGMNLSHPIAGPLLDEGGMWPEDQFTFRRIEDRDIVRVTDTPAPTAIATEGAEIVREAPIATESADPSANPRRR